MKVKDMTLRQWQDMLDRFKRESPLLHKPNETPACFRIDGTQFSTARFYGGFTYNGARYTTFECRETKGAGFCEFATIAARFDFLTWTADTLKAEAKAKKEGGK